MKVSIVMPVFNRLEYTQKCLESIFKFGSKFEFEIIVVDNASTDSTKEYLTGMPGKIVTVHNKENLGFAKACNQGASKAIGEYILFLNNDTIVTENWMDVLAAELDENSQTAMAGSKLLYPDETIQHAGVVFGEDKIPYHIYAREIKEKHYVNKKRKFNAVTAACMLLRREIFDEVGGFDENFLNGYEDIDLCLKIKELGKDIIYCPESLVYHYESISEGRGGKHKENQELFLQRWGDKIQQDDFIYMKEDNTQNQNLLIKNQENEIRQLKSLLLARETELEYIKSSKYNKMRHMYFKIKFVIFSPHKFLQKYFKKTNYLLKSLGSSLRNEGVFKSLLRFWNYAIYGKGVLDYTKINKEEEYTNLKDVLGKFRK
jgi:GT2 family glycosyltransferase